jgi:hypothetical protein
MEQINLSKEQFNNISKDRYKLLKKIVQRFVDEPVIEEDENLWLNGVHSWCGNDKELENYHIEYGVFIKENCTSRHLSDLTELAIAVEGFGFVFGSWGVRDGCLYLCFDEKKYLVKNPLYKDELKEQEQLIEATIKKKIKQGVSKKD